VTGAAGVRLISGRGSAAAVPGLLAGRRVLVVASERAAERWKLADWLPPDATVFGAFWPNPTTRQAVAAAAARSGCAADVVLGIGGGSALDVAKAARALPADPSLADDVLAGQSAPLRGAQLILVPTTAGTGSEVTRFATLYRAARKLSLDAAGVRADVAVVDPALTDSCPADLTWNCAFDTLAHAVESMWSTRASQRSRDYAEAALTLLLPILRNAGELPLPPERDLLSEAATLAGRAIDRTRTTAAHAMAYPLTMHLGVPHGRACALNLTWLAPLVEAQAPAGVDVLHRVFGVAPGGLGGQFRALLARRGMLARLAADRGLADLIVDEGLSSNRMSGTPITLDRGLVRESILELLEVGHA
jgi:alcohol dehydrogenase class IV